MSPSLRPLRSSESPMDAALQCMVEKNGVGKTIDKIAGYVDAECAKFGQDGSGEMQEQEEDLFGSPASPKIGAIAPPTTPTKDAEEPAKETALDPVEDFKKVAYVPGQTLWSSEWGKSAFPEGTWPGSCRENLTPEVAASPECLEPAAVAATPTPVKALAQSMGQMSLSSTPETLPKAVCKPAVKKPLQRIPLRDAPKASKDLEEDKDKKNKKDKHVKKRKAGKEESVEAQPAHKDEAKKGKKNEDKKAIAKAKAKAKSVAVAKAKAKAAVGKSGKSAEPKEPEHERKGKKPKKDPEDDAPLGDEPDQDEEAEIKKKMHSASWL